MQNKIAVVSGGAGGIGRVVVLRLSEAGFFPVILDKNQVAGEQLLFSLPRRGKKGAFVALDLMVKAEVHNAFAKINADYGRIDVLVNLAGGTFHKKVIQDLSLAEWRDVINMNLKATFLCCQAVIATMKRQTKGSIVNTASNFGITGSAERTHYSAAKAALIAFSKSLALELAPHGIRVNVIAPGMTATERVMSKLTATGWTEAGKAIPMGRAAEPRDIAEGVAFLAAEESGYITGQTLHVNGAMVLP